MYGVTPCLMMADRTGLQSGSVMKPHLPGSLRGVTQLLPVLDLVMPKLNLV